MLRCDLQLHEQLHKKPYSMHSVNATRVHFRCRIELVYKFDKHLAVNIVNAT